MDNKKILACQTVLNRVICNGVKRVVSCHIPIGMTQNETRNTQHATQKAWLRNKPLAKLF
jgi:hypothetical protein